jgi:hypothetical protein
MLSGPFVRKVGQALPLRAEEFKAPRAVEFIEWLRTKASARKAQRLDPALAAGDGRLLAARTCNRVPAAVSSFYEYLLIDLDEGTVSQGGPRRLWEAFEELYGWLDRLGRPERDRFGLTVRSNGSQVVWLDDPDSGRPRELEDGLG